MTYTKSDKIEFDNKLGSSTRHMPVGLEGRIFVVWNFIEAHFENKKLPKPDSFKKLNKRSWYREYLMGKNLHAIAYFAFLADTVSTKEGKARSFSMYKEWLLEGSRMRMLNNGSNEILKEELVREIINERFPELE